jgi:uroporphyrinogen-III synthase
MSSERINLLSTRNLQGKTITESVSKNIFIEEISFIKTQPILNKDLSYKISQINLPAIFTSIHAVESVVENLKQNNLNFKIQSAFSISGRTAYSLKKNGIKILGSASSSSELAKIIIQSKTKKLVYFCGNKRRDELSEILSNENILLYEVIIYETILTPSKVDENIFDGILFFSPSAVESYLTKNTLTKRNTSFCIGKTTADAVLKTQPDSKIIISDEPSEAGLLKSIYKFYNIND